MRGGRATVSTASYGAHPDQAGDLHLPAQRAPAVVCLLHGGFWRMPYGRDQMTAMAADLAGRGFAVWNLGYRRLGVAGGGWPGTLDDVVAGIGHLARLAVEGIDLDLTRVVVCGHSAGGHLALCAARRCGRPGVDQAHAGIPIRMAVGLAPLADLARAQQLDLGRGAVGEFLGGGTAAAPERVRAASPRALLPLGVPQLILHGTGDDVVPIAMSREYAAAARAAGDAVELVELPGLGHMEHLEPASAAHRALCDRLAERTARPKGD